MAQEFWVFGYGSLMWRPEFPHAERQVATLSGYARRFCLRSVRYRGTPAAPGLVLALDRQPGAACTGVAYLVAAAEAEAVYQYLHAREMVTGAYAEARLPVSLAGGGEVEALAYVSNPAHPQYCAGLSHATQAAIIARAVGPAGSNRDYLFSTLAHLDGLGIPDPELAALGALVRGLGSEGTEGEGGE